MKASTTALPEAPAFCSQSAGQLLADLHELGLEGRGGRLDLHALGGELLEVPVGLLLGDLPAAGLGLGGGLEEAVLRRLVEGGEGQPCSRR